MNNETKLLGKVLSKEDLRNILVLDVLIGFVLVFIMVFFALNSSLGYLKLTQLIGLIAIFVGGCWFCYLRISIIRKLKLW